MSVYERLATTIQTEITKTSGLEFIGSDTPFRDFILEFVKEMLPILLDCFADPARALHEANNPGVISRVRLRFGVNQKLREGDVINLYAGPLFRAILVTGKTITADDLAEARLLDV